MTDNIKDPRKRSVLQDRIDAGLADPIRDEERAIVRELRRFYEKKFNKR